MAVGANRWPPVWLVRLTRVAPSGPPSSAMASANLVPRDPQQRSLAPCVQINSSRPGRSADSAGSAGSATESRSREASETISSGGPTTSVRRYADEWARVGAVEHGLPGAAVPFVGHERLEATVHARHLAGQGLELGDLADVPRPRQRPLEEEEGAVRPDRADGVDLVLTGPLRAQRPGVGDHRSTSRSHASGQFRSALNRPRHVADTRLDGRTPVLPSTPSGLR